LVAIKIARAVLGSRQEIARFESERQALATLQHPGIATIFDRAVINGPQNLEEHRGLRTHIT
jgi:hypothetical protein